MRARAVGIWAVVALLGALVSARAAAESDIAASRLLQRLVEAQTHPGLAAISGFVPDSVECLGVFSPDAGPVGTCTVLGDAPGDPTTPIVWGITAYQINPGSAAVGITTQPLFPGGS